MNVVPQAVSPKNEEYVEFEDTVGYSYTSSGKLEFKRSYFILDWESGEWVPLSAERVNWHVSRTKRYGEALFRVPVGSVLKLFEATRKGVTTTYYIATPGGLEELPHETVEETLFSEAGVTVTGRADVVRLPDGRELRFPWGRYVVRGGGRTEVYERLEDALADARERARRLKSGRILVYTGDYVSELRNFAQTYNTWALAIRILESGPRLRIETYPPNWPEIRAELRDLGAYIKSGIITIPLTILVSPSRYQRILEILEPLVENPEKLREDLARLHELAARVVPEVKRFFAGKLGLSEDDIQAVWLYVGGRLSTLMTPRYPHARVKTRYLGKEKFKEIASNYPYREGAFEVPLGEDFDQLALWILEQAREALG